MFITLISQIVADMSAAAVVAEKPAIGFGHGDKAFQNLLLDEAAFPFVWLAQPLENDYLLSQSGYVGEDYSPRILFLYRSNLDWLPEEHDVGAIQPANLLIKEFISRCQSHPNISEVLKATGLELVNVLDVNLSGKSLSITLKTSNTDSVCID